MTSYEVGSAVKRGGASVTTRPHSCGLLVVAALSLLAAASTPAGSGPGRANTRDAWYETLLAGRRVGYVHESVRAGGDSTLVTTVASMVVVERFGERTEMSRDERWTEADRGRALFYESVLRMARDEVSLSLRARPAGYVLIKTSGARKESSFIDVGGEMLFPRGIDMLHAERGFRIGDRYVFRTFDPDFESVSTCSVAVVGPDTLDLAGETRALHVVEVRPDLYGGVVFREWRDDSGALWAQAAPELSTATLRTTGEVTRADIVLTDIAEDMVVDSNVIIPRPELVDEALYEISLEGGDPSDLLADPPRQVVEGRTDTGVLLRVRRLVPDGSTGAVPGSEASEYLESNAILQKDDPRVARAAEDAVRGAGPDPWTRSVRIEGAVRKLIDDRGFGVGFASAAEVLRTRSGDCSEHAVLAAAMERAVGIPSRLATGVVHFRGGFAYHMWLEVWSGDGWYSLDPTRGEGSVDAAHIRLGTSSLAGGRIGELSLPILRTADKLRIRVVEYTAAGVTTRTD